MSNESSANLAYFDDLTGLNNRRYLYAQLPKEIDQARSQQYALWIFMLDIDNYKMINDTYGHLTGDEVLKDLANILKENTKSNDIKIRYAGDEFAVILPHMEENNVLRVAERLRTKVRMHNFKDRRSQKDIHLTISLGVVGFPKDAATATELIDIADKALYMSKEKGRDRISSASEITPELFWKRDVLERFPCRKFVNRKKEVSVLKDALGSVLGGKGKIFLINGELGIGKSRLLTELEKDAVKEGVMCLRTKCAEKNMLQSFFALGTVLYEYFIGLNNLPSEVLADISDPEAEALFIFLPVLGDLASAHFKEDKQVEPSILRSALGKLLVNISKVKPFCFFCDDVQYIDSHSLEVMLQFGDKIQSQPILMILAHSFLELPKADSESYPFYKIFNTGALGAFCHVDIARLSCDEIGEMTAAILLNFPLTSDFFGLLNEITKGNPLFLEELLKYMIAKELIFYKNGAWQLKSLSRGQLPSSLKETIHSRIDALDNNAREIIAKAAVIGDEFQVDMLQKLGSEDRGYILDIVEAARKTGLLYGKGASERDEFSFATEEVRKIIFDYVGGDRTKELYASLGQLKERLYPDNLKGIASELHYNFKKAENLAKTEEYSKLAKEGGGAVVYDKTLRYARTLLEEAAKENKVCPLSRKSWFVVLEIIRHFYIASINQKIYPPNNSMRSQFIDEVHQRLLEVFLEVDLLIIGCAESGIFVNSKKVGKELTSFFSHSLAALMAHHDIKSITFHKGMNREELLVLVEMLGGVRELEEGFSEGLKKEKVVNIVVQEITFDKSQKSSKEKNDLQEVMLLDYLLGKFSLDADKKDMPEKISARAEEIAQALEQFGEEASKGSGKDKDAVKAGIVAKGIQKMGQQFFEQGSENWAQYKEGIAKVFLNMNPDLRSDVLTHSFAGQDGSEKVNIIKELSQSVSGDVLVEAIVRQYNKKDVNVEEVKKYIDEILGMSAEKDKFSSALREKLHKAGASDEECDFLLENKMLNDLPLEEKTQRVLAWPSSNLLKVLPGLNVGMLLDQMMLNNEEARTASVLERLFGILAEDLSRYTLLRRAFEDALDIIIRKEYKTLLVKFAGMFFDLCPEDNLCSAHFMQLLEIHLKKIIEFFVDVPRFDLIKKMMQRYCLSKEKTYATLEVFDEVAKFLVGTLVRRISNDLDYLELQEVLILLSGNSIKYLIEEGLFVEGVPEGNYFEAYLRRRTLGRILGQMPLQDVLSHLKERLADPREFIVKNLIELVRSIQNDDVLIVLEPLIKHPNAQIRRKIVICLGKRSEYQSARLLGAFLIDKEQEIRKEALQYLKERKDGSATRVLREVAKRTDVPGDIKNELKGIASDEPLKP
jgi:diguanylate cyclase (GGDEF)-like protein